MNRIKFGSARDWVGTHGDAIFPVEDRGARRLTVEVVMSDGLLVWAGEGQELVLAVGPGHHVVEVGIQTGGAVQLHAKATARASVRIDGVKPRETGWTGSASHTDLEPRPMGAVSPEVQAMFDTMSRNMLALRAQLDAVKR